MKSWLKYKYEILLVCISFLAIYPFFKSGFFPFHDETQIANLYEMIRGFQSGQFPPRWAPDFTFGYGYPFFNFYYPLPFYVGTFFYFIFKTNLIWSLKISMFLTVPLSALAFYFFMKNFFRQNTAFAAAIMYIFTPYRAVDLYVRGAIGELWGFVFMPLVLHFLFKAIASNKKRNIALAAMSIGGMIIAHNLSAFIFFPFVIIFSLLVIGGIENKKQGITNLIISFILGLFLSAFYVLPALMEKRFVQSGTPFNPIDHFPFIFQLIKPFWGYGASVWGPGDGMSFQIGSFNLGLIFLSLIILVFFLKKIEKQKRKYLIYFISTIIFTIFLMNIRSLFLWNLLPLGEYVQFPWRLLMLTTVFSSILLGFIGEIIPPKKQLLILVFPLLAVCFTIGYFKPEKSIIVNDDYYLKRFFANRITTGESKDISKEYFNFSEDYLPPIIWAKERPINFPEKKIRTTTGDLTYLEISPVIYWAKIKSQSPATIIFYNHFFPGWKSFVDGREVTINYNNPNGLISIRVPGGNHEIKFQFVNTPVREMGNLISLLSIVPLIVFLLI